ncbi:MAG: Na+/H+ antiporter subunit E [Lachnospiraceae bacterium]|nr:Na+/H+ antiporter subunit E [Lachnospiraceae bacterium]
MYLFLMAIWIILNGRITLEVLAFGLVISAALYWFICKFMDYGIGKDIRILDQIFSIIRYAFVLVLEIIKANLAVIHLIISGKDQIEPALVSFRTDLKTDTAKAFMANAITLTPGTITVTLTEDEYVVHCLDKDLAYGMNDTVISRMLIDMEEKSTAGMPEHTPEHTTEETGQSGQRLKHESGKSRKGRKK